MRGQLSLEDLGTLADTGQIDTVLVCIVDMQGRLMGKRFHVQHFLDSAHAETHCCNYLLATDLEMYTVSGYASTSWERGYGDYTMRPDLSTLRIAGWLEGTAIVLSDILDHHGHAPVAISPRQMLKTQLARAKALGFDVIAATELEFFVFAKSYDEIRKSGFRDLEPISGYNEDYHILQTTKEEGVMRALRNGLYASGIPVEGTKGEAEAGQEELNIRYAGALETAEYHSIAKHAAKEVGWQQGRAISFLPKWHEDRVGSASHVHLSLWNDDTPAFYDPDAPLGMSKTMRAFSGGLLKYLGDYTVFFAPYVNSYKRFREGTFAPTAKVWSVDNRTAAYRLCGDGSKAIRMECRLPGADMNPYVTIAAMIAAGLAGIEEGLDCGDPFTGDAYEATDRIPSTLRAATEALRGSKMMRAAFGDEVVDHYTHAADWEQRAFDKVVTDWEIARGFERA